LPSVPEAPRARYTRCMTRHVLILGFGLSLIAGAALADPCKAIPDKGPMPAFLHRGAVFSGPVTYVGDGDGLCVAVGAAPDQWVEVRLADFYAPELSEPGGREAKRALETLVMGKTASCVSEKQSYDRVVARCQLDGVSIGDRLRRGGAAEGGRGKKRRSS
jgi:micrococcal nuclease